MVRTLLHGRVRTSTLVLAVLFAGVLATYFVVRPAPTPPTANDNQAPATTTPPAATRTTSPSRSPSPRASVSTPPSVSVSPSASPSPVPSHRSLLPLPTHS